LDSFLTKYFFAANAFIYQVNTQTMPFKSITHNCIAMFSLKTLAGFEPVFLILEADSMSTALSRQGDFGSI
jgi:hypothetical protein